jgi:DNA polymerase-3 subunit alpha
MINLHNHTEYSIGDAINTPVDLAEAALACGQSAIALTDHGNIGGFLDFIIACEERDVKPIVGMEAYLCYNLEKNKDARKYWHCLLLAKDAVGLSNLITLTSKSYDEGFYRKPRILFDWLEQYKEGLICATACRGGIVAPAIDNGLIKDARDTLKKFKDLFGDDFYGEIQIIEPDGTDSLNTQIVTLCNQLDIKTIVTADAHYRHKDQALVHDRFIKIHAPKLEYTTKRLWIKDAQEIQDENNQFGCFTQADVGDFLLNTDDIGNKVVQYDLDKSDIFKMQISNDDNAQFQKEVTNGWNRYKANIPNRQDRQHYLQRIQSEYRVISGGGFCTYFLMVQDIVRHARGSGIAVGPGRGSAVGCLCGFLMGITKIDPIKNGLIFERFLNEGRLDPKRAKIFGAALPDIDLDFSAKRRPEIKQYIFDKYPGKSTSIGTFGTIKIKTAIKDVAHQKGIPFFDINLVTKHLDPDLTIPEAVASDGKFALWYQSNKDWVDKEVAPLIGRIRQEGIHAAGVVVSSKPIAGLLPTKTIKPKMASADTPRVQVSQFNDKNCEKMGMVKFDILGLSTLDTIERCLELVKNSGTTVDIDNIDTEDKKVYELYKSGHVGGVFQYDTEMGREMINLLKPSKFYDLVVGTALNRPAVLDLGLHRTFVKRKNGEQSVQYDHPLLEDVVDDTYGILVFQEQLIKAVMKVGNMSAVEADLFRVATGKKDKSLMKRELQKFVKAAKNNGVDQATADKLATKFEKFAGYSFNKSHSCAYALIGYQAAWLKCYYPLEFYCALLDSCDQEKYNTFIVEARRQGIEVNAPKVGKSEERFSVDNGQIYMPLSSIKGIGEKLSNRIIGLKASSLQELFDEIPKREMNIAKFCTLVAAGTLTELNDYKDIVTLATTRYKTSKEELAKRVGKFDVNDLLGFMVKDDSKKLRAKFPALDKVPFIKDIDDKLKGYATQTLGVISTVSEQTTKNKSKMAFVGLRDSTGECSVLLWEQNLNKLKNSLVPGNIMVVAAGKKGRGNSVICDSCKILTPNLVEVGSA